jgi:leucine dehydrogenase
MIFRAHGRFVESLGGRYVTAEDVGTSTADMDFVHMETDYVAGLANKSGDPSPVTAHGVFRAIEASAKHRWGSASLEGKTVTVQGLGNVGTYLCRELRAAGAKLIVTDIRSARVKNAVDEFGATAVEGDAIYEAKADIFAPCALGAILNDETIPKLKVEIVCGGANNQLLEPAKHAEALEKRGISYAPDFVANAGGVINVYSELAGWTRERALRTADEIFDTVLGVYQIAKEEGQLTYLAADKLAERRINAVHGLVRTWPQWPNKS